MLSRCYQRGVPESPLAASPTVKNNLIVRAPKPTAYTHQVSFSDGKITHLFVLGPLIDNPAHTLYLIGLFLNIAVRLLVFGAVVVEYSSVALPSLVKYLA